MQRFLQCRTVHPVGPAQAHGFFKNRCCIHSCAVPSDVVLCVWSSMTLVHLLFYICFPLCFVFFVCMVLVELNGRLQQWGHSLCLPDHALACFFVPMIGTPPVKKCVFFCLEHAVTSFFALWFGVQVAIRNIRRDSVDVVKKAEKAKSLGKDQVRRRW